MKRILAILVTVAVVVCGAVPAMADYFDNDHLMMAVYNRTDKEVAIDLGDYDLVDYSIPGQTLAVAGSVDIEGAGKQFGSTIDSWDDLHVGLFTGYKDTSNVYHLVIGTTQNQATEINGAARATFLNGSSAVHLNYRTPGAEQVNIGSAGALSSYTTKLDAGAYGQMAGFNPYNAPLAGPDLGVIASQGFIDLYIYDYTIVGLGASATVPLVPGNGVDYQGIIRLNADGSIVTVAASNPVVPIPGALVLFASGLVGLIGIRRRNA
ncbi:MAG: hypothetical protein ABIK15_20055 [Pseudomonadota bacterium]